MVTAVAPLEVWNQRPGPTCAKDQLVRPSGQSGLSSLNASVSPANDVCGDPTSERARTCRSCQGACCWRGGLRFLMVGGLGAGSLNHVGWLVQWAIQRGNDVRSRTANPGLALLDDPAGRLPHFLQRYQDPHQDAANSGTCPSLQRSKQPASTTNTHLRRPAWLNCSTDSPKSPSQQPWGYGLVV